MIKRKGIVADVEVWSYVFSCDKNSDTRVFEHIVSKAGMEYVIGVSVFGNLYFVSIIYKRKDGSENFWILACIDQRDSLLRFGVHRR